ncbi:hypothetical protein BDY21DRAFT_346276 [Lineolata rhizophorae]|uniref:Uncharacterized protein n=1 Tax=Lineolata rhizophorae TaxID=578093 RepID=A0A6A6NYP5_9PEZI|nr:hypothetical protein BDY21DRAFT_346276 [Lineolata rhizophorae]
MTGFAHRPRTAAARARTAAEPIRPTTARHPRTERAKLHDAARLPLTATAGVRAIARALRRYAASVIQTIVAGIGHRRVGGRRPRNSRPKKWSGRSRLCKRTRTSWRVVGESVLRSGRRKTRMKRSRADVACRERILPPACIARSLTLWRFGK